jgi:RHS repeat-associated protein
VPGATGGGTLAYAGQHWDADVGLSYAQQRWYSPEVGRFLSEDPVFGDLANPSSLHGFGYGNGNPMLYTDPEGEAAVPDYVMHREQVRARIERFRAGMSAEELKLTTYGAALVKTKDGKVEMWIAGAGKTGRVRPGLKEGSDQVIRNKLKDGNEVNRFNDAEQTIAREIKDKGAKLLWGETTRDMCGSCQAELPEELLSKWGGRRKPSESWASRLPDSQEAASKLALSALQPHQELKTAVEGAAVVIYLAQFDHTQNAQFARAKKELEGERSRIEALVSNGYSVRAYAVMNVPLTVNLLKDIFPEASDLETFNSLFIDFYRVDASGREIRDGPSMTAASSPATMAPSPAELPPMRRLKQYPIAEFGPAARKDGSALR